MDTTASKRHVTINPERLTPGSILTDFTLVNDAYSVHVTTRRLKQANASVLLFDADEMNEIEAISEEIADRVRAVCAQTSRSMGFVGTTHQSPEKLSEDEHYTTFLTVSLREIRPRSNGPDESTTLVSIEIRLDR